MTADHATEAVRLLNTGDSEAATVHALLAVTEAIREHRPVPSTVGLSWPERSTIDATIGPEWRNSL